MMMLAAVMAALVGTATADHLFGQCRNAPNNTALCPTTFQGFHMFCNATDLAGARQVCRQNNMQLAVVNDGNSGGALQTQMWCMVNGEAAWIESFNGLSGEPCMVQYFNGFAGTINAGGCTQLQFPVLCQEIPRQVSTLTSVVSKTMWTGVDIHYTTVTPTVCNRRRHHKNNLPEPKVFLQDAIVAADNNFVPPPRPCANTCSVPESRFLRMGQEAVPFSMAAAACKRHGWQLADFTTGMSAQVGALLEKCSPQGLGWVRSNEGVDGAACIFAYRNGPLSDGQGGVQGSFGYSANSCDNVIGPVFPICDIRCQPARTGSGPDQGTTTSFTSVTRTTTWTSVPLSVETVTITQWPKHDPKNPGCCCRSCAQ